MARYVVNTDPTSIVEELLPVAVPVYSDPPAALSRDAAEGLLHVSPRPETRTEPEVREALADALAIPGLDALLVDAVEARRQELVAERRSMKRQMEQQAGALAAEWLQGIDDLSPGSYDLLALTLLIP